MTTRFYSKPHSYQPAHLWPYSLEKIISGIVEKAPSDFHTCVVVEDPGLYGTVVTGLHCGAEGAVLQTANGQTWLGDDVEEGVLLRRAGSEGDRW